ncbi:hypothetical protein [Kordia sp.]|uniref:hypothetical protein n=1 Tax=Kordia sp. TaxID=1965332 RepID=UPI003D274369
MAYYYVNKNAQSNGDHEVHKSGCSWLPKEENRIYLGSFDNCKDAVKEAKKYYDDVNGCYYCSNNCHTS